MEFVVNIEQSRQIENLRKGRTAWNKIEFYLISVYRLIVVHETTFFEGNSSKLVNDATLLLR